MHALLSRIFRLARRLGPLPRIAGPGVLAGIIFLSLATGRGRAAPVLQVVESGEAPLRDSVVAVARAPDGTLVVGSNSLAVFDGTRWTTIDVPGAYAFRALATAQATSATTPLRPGQPAVWVGGIGALGYLARDATHAWRFHSLAAEARAAGVGALDDVWLAQAAGDGAIWVSNQRVLRWQGDRFEHWSLLSEPRLLAYPGVEAAWVYQDGVGLLRISASGEPQLVLPAALLPAAPVTWLVESTTASGTLWLGLGDGAYRWRGGERCEPLPALTRALAGKLPCTAVALPDGGLAVGTLKGGVVLAAATGAVETTLTSAHGLPDDTVHALAADGDRLWLGLSQALGRIDGAGFADLFARQAQLGAGLVREVVAHAGAAHILTSKAVWQAAAAGTAPERRELQPRLAQQALLWDATSAAGRLWVGGFGGVWDGTASGAEHVHHTSADVMQLAPTRRVPVGILFLEGYDLRLLEQGARDEWVPRDLGARISDTPVSLVEDPAGDVWVSTVTAGIYRFGWNEPQPDVRPALRLRVHYRDRQGLPAGLSRPRLAALGGRLFALAEQGVLALRASGSTFEPVAALGEFVALDATPGREPGVSYWLVRSRHLPGSSAPAVVQVTQGTAEESPVTGWTPVTVPGLEAIGSAQSLTLVSGTSDPSRSELWISGSRGVLRVPMDRATSVNSPPPPVTLEIAVTHRTGETENVAAWAVATPAAGKPASTGKPEPATEAVTLRSGVTKLEFRHAAPASAGGETLFFRTRLESVDTAWAAPTASATRELSGLAPGRYRFAARSVDRFGREGPEAMVSFTLTAPWYRQPLAYVGHALVLLGVGALIVRARLRRLRRQNEELNRLVAARTRELELSNTAKNEFLENISHEIRNPLHGLTGLLALLKEDQLGPRERELTHSLRAVAGHLQRVFEDVLDFSKLEYGYIKLQRRPFRLRALLEEIVALFAVTARQQGCELRVEWPPECEDGFLGDSDRLKTIIGNFVANALKYAPGAPITLRVQVAATEHDAVVDVFVEITDHGPGVPVEEQELIFNKFVRGSRARDGDIAGTGLGLATARTLARLMGGDVGLHSTPGMGATFFVGLPLARVAPAALAERPDSSAQPPPDATAPAAALIVEDEAYNRLVLEGIARELGYHADLAGDAAQAGAWLARTRYAVVFLDWELPDAKGGDVAQLVRAQPGGEHPIILATTAHDSDEMRARCRAAGMDGFLLKPYDAAQVQRMIDEVRTQRRPTENSDARQTTSPAQTANEDPGDGRITRAPVGPPRRRVELTAPADYRRALDAACAELAQALAAREARAIQTSAHRLRGLAGVAGAQELNLHAREIEALASDGVVQGTALATHWAGVQSSRAALTAELA